MYGYLANFCDIGYYYEGAREGNAFSFGLFAPEKPSLDSWFRFSFLVNAAGRLDRSYLKNLGDLSKEIDSYRQENAIFKTRHAVLFIDRREDTPALILNDEGRIQEDKFDGNISFMKVVEIGDIPKSNGKRKGLKHLAGKPIEIQIPHPFRVYRFRSYRDESNVLAERVMELMNLGY